MKTDRTKSIFAHPAVALLGLVIAPVAMYHWVSSVMEEQVRHLESPIAGRDGKPTSVTSREPVERMVHAPGVRPSVFYAPGQITLSQNDEVVGVLVNGQPRAYLLDALRDLSHCVVNDVVGERAVAVIYAADEQRIRVLVSRRKQGVAPTSSGEPALLNVGITGEIGGQLMISYRGQDFFSDEPLQGLSDYPFSHCTWSTWRHAYPDTDIYIGESHLGAE